MAISNADVHWFCPRCHMRWGPVATVGDIIERESHREICPGGYATWVYVIEKAAS
jgi:hypothetical protein